MKTRVSVLCVCISMLCCAPLKAQFLAAGYQINRANFPGLNRVITSYNHSNTPGLYRGMKNFGLLQGISIGFGRVSKNFYNNFHYDYTGQTQSAFGPDWNKTEFHREVRVGHHAGGFSMGRFFESKPVAFGFGFRFTAGALLTDYRNWQEGTEKPAWTNLDNFFYSSLGPNLIAIYKRRQWGLLLDASYNFALFNQNMTAVDEILNKTNYNGSKSDRLNNRTHYFGLALKLLFFFGKHESR